MLSPPRWGERGTCPSENRSSRAREREGDLSNMDPTLRVEELKRRMHEVRQNLRFEVNEVVDNASELADWRYYVRSRPIVTLAVVAVIGYWLVPKSKPVWLYAKRRRSGLRNRERGDGNSELGSTGREHQAMAREKQVDGTGSSEPAGRSEQAGQREEQSQKRAKSSVLVSLLGFAGPILLRVATNYVVQRVARAFGEEERERSERLR